VFAEATGFHVAAKGRRVAAAVARTSLALAIAASSMASFPASAVASRLDSDRVDGVELAAQEIPESSAPDVSARAGRLVTADGRVLWARSDDTARAMASTTKVMTALLVLESSELDDTVKITKAASGVDYALGLKTGEKLSVRKLLELALVASSNDAATALAIHVGGSPSDFAVRMNERAAELGLADTRFVNAHGLDAAGHHSSARDLEKLLKLAMDEPEFRRIVAKRSVKMPAYKDRPGRSFKSTDRLLGDIEGLRGGKTGFTDDAKYCMVADAERDDIALTAVVLGASSSKKRFGSTKTLLEWGFEHYRNRTLCSTTQGAGQVPVSADPRHQVSTRFAETKAAPVLDLLGPVTKQVSLQGSVALPVFAGQRLGTARIMQGDTVLATVDAVASAPMASAEETVAAVAVKGYARRTVIAKAARSTSAVARFDTTRAVDKVVNLPRRVPAPIAVGQKLGSITYKQDGRDLVTVPVIAAQAVETPSPLAQLGALIVSGLQLVTGA